MKRNIRVRFPRNRMSIALATVLLGVSGASQGMSIDVGNPDIDLRWDNTVRYTGAWRVNPISPAFYRSPGYDETEGRFKSGDMIINRVDLLSELDFIYQGKYGFRVSGAAWNEMAYGTNSVRNPAISSSNYANGAYNSYARRYIVGPSGELLDAFVFGTFELGQTSLSVKLGQHNVYWGESLYFVSNSIAYAQGAVDTIKAATSPGAEAKELYLPRNQLSAQMQLTDTFSVAGQYAFAWAPYRIVPGGTYFASGDAARSDYAAPGLPNGPDLTPKNHGDFGVNARWSPAELGGTVGLYFRKFDEKLPWGFTQVTPAGSSLRYNFARGTELYGVSFTRNISTVSVGTEMSFRRNTALNAVGGYVVRPTNGSSASYAEAEGPRGNTLHAVINAVYLLPRSPLWAGGTLQGEINYSRLLAVTTNPNLYNGVGYGCPAGQTKNDGCSTKDAWGINIGFTPQWPQAIAGWDISMPMSLAYQIAGNGPALGGGNQGSISWSIGVTGLLYSKYELGVKYVSARARYNVNPITGVVTTTNGSNAVQSQHDWVALTFKTTF